MALITQSEDWYTLADGAYIERILNVLVFRKPDSIEDVRVYETPEQAETALDIIAAESVEREGRITTE